MAHWRFQMKTNPDPATGRGEKQRSRRDVGGTKGDGRSEEVFEGNGAGQRSAVQRQKREQKSRPRETHRDADSAQDGGATRGKATERGTRSRRLPSIEECAVCRLGRRQ